MREAPHTRTDKINKHWKSLATPVKYEIEARLRTDIDRAHLNTAHTRYINQFPHIWSDSIQSNGIESNFILLIHARNKAEELTLLEPPKNLARALYLSVCFMDRLADNAYAYEHMSTITSSSFNSNVPGSAHRCHKHTQISNRNAQKRVCDRDFVCIFVWMFSVYMYIINLYLYKRKPTHLSLKSNSSDTQTHTQLSNKRLQWWRVNGLKKVSMMCTHCHQIVACVLNEHSLTQQYQKLNEHPQRTEWSRINDQKINKLYVKKERIKQKQYKNSFLKRTVTN